MSAPSPRDIFVSALDIDDPVQRRAYLDEQCAGDRELFAKVDGLLRAHDDAGSFLERSPLECVDATVLTDAGSGSPPHGTQADERNTNATEVLDSNVAVDDAPTLSFLEPSDDPGSLGRLADYEILEAVGHGGLGVVLKARDPRLNRIVAIKVPRPEFAANAAARKRFTREAQAAAAVSHDHVVTIHRVGECPGHGDRRDSFTIPYLVMEYIDGISLQDRLNAEGPLELREILRIGMQAGRGLAAAHEQGLVHRDIKPANILLENGIQRVKISDFGLARAVDDVGVTQTGTVTGTPQYMSPEQACGEKVDHRSDLFSLGCVLYAMCTGRPPFRAESTMAVLKRVCEDTPKPIRQVNPEIPDWLCEIVEKLLEKDPEHRFQSAISVADLLGQHLAHLQQPEANPRPRRLAPPPPAQVDQRPAARRWVGISLATLGLLIVIVFGITTLSRSGGPVRDLVWRTFGTTGRLAVECSGPAAEVTLNGRRIAVSRDGTATMLVPPGDFEIVAIAGGQMVSTEWHDVTRGVDYLVRIAPKADVIRVRGPLTESEKARRFARGVAAVGDPAHFGSSTAITGNSDDADAGTIPEAGTEPPLATAPFNPDQALTHQNAWAQYLNLPVEHVNSLGMTLRLIPPGEFQMGLTDAELRRVQEEIESRGGDEFAQFVARSGTPRHPVRLTKPWYLGTCEVTVGQFRQFVEETGYASTLESADPPTFTWQRFGDEDGSDRQPVIGVSWEDATAFCEWLSEREQVTYELPSEAQWEFACRAGSEGRWSCGDDVFKLGEFAVIGRAEQPLPETVAGRSPNAFGLFDMHGNAEEWCRDWHANGFYRVDFATDPVYLDSPGDPNSGRVVRGGSWRSPIFWTGSAMRSYDNARTPVHVRGFRIAVTGDLSNLSRETPVSGGDPGAASSPETSDDSAAALFRRFERTAQESPSIALLYDGEMVVASNNGEIINRSSYGGSYEIKRDGKDASSEHFNNRPLGHGARSGLLVRETPLDFDPPPYNFYIGPVTRSGFYVRALSEYVYDRYKNPAHESDPEQPLLTEEGASLIKAAHAQGFWEYLMLPVENVGFSRDDSGDVSSGEQVLHYDLRFSDTERASITLRIDATTMAPRSRIVALNLDDKRLTFTEQYRGYTTDEIAEPFAENVRSPRIASMRLVSGNLLQETGDGWGTAEWILSGTTYRAGTNTRVLMFDGGSVIEFAPGSEFQIEDNDISLTAGLLSARLVYNAGLTLTLGAARIHSAPLTSGRAVCTASPDRIFVEQGALRGDDPGHGRGGFLLKEGTEYGLREDVLEELPDRTLPPALRVDADERVVYQLDFTNVEDVQARLTLGLLGEDAGRPVLKSISQTDHRRAVIELSGLEEDPLFRLQPYTHLRFRYRLAGSENYADLYLHNRDRDLNYREGMSFPQPDHWTTCTIPVQRVNVTYDGEAPEPRQDQAYDRLRWEASGRDAVLLIDSVQVVDIQDEP